MSSFAAPLRFFVIAPKRCLTFPCRRSYSTYPAMSANEARPSPKGPANKKAAAPNDKKELKILMLHGRCLWDDTLLYFAMVRSVCAMAYNAMDKSACWDWDHIFIWTKPLAPTNI